MKLFERFKFHSSGPSVCMRSAATTFQFRSTPLGKSIVPQHQAKISTVLETAYPLDAVLLRANSGTLSDEAKSAEQRKSRPSSARVLQEQAPEVSAEIEALHRVGLASKLTGPGR